MRPDLGPKPLLGYTASILARVAERRGDKAFLAACAANGARVAFAIGGELVVMRRTANGPDPLFRAEEVYAFTDRLYRAHGPEEIHQAALDAITRGLGCSRAAILLFDTAGVMRFVAWRGLSNSYRSAVEGHSPWARDVKDPAPICIADVETADLPEPLKATVKAERIGALAFFPVVANGALIGKFMTYHDAAHVLSETDVNLALTIARQLGFGLERMRAEQSGRLLASIIANSDDAIVLPASTRLRMPRRP